MPQTPTLAILGFGTMGRALAKQLDPARLRIGVRRPAQGQFTVAEAARGADILVLAVKPKDIAGLLEELDQAGAFAHKPLLVSIAAGFGTARLAALAGDCPIVRAMPNTPCAIQQGATVICRGPRAEDAHVGMARALLEPLGAVLELDEKHMDTVTGLSGSGPAFIYVVLEAMAEGAVMRGLPRAAALELAARVAQGAAAMVLATGRHPAALRDEVTTPAGCTAAGLMALEDGRLRSVLARGVETAAKRAGELAG